MALAAVGSRMRMVVRLASDADAVVTAAVVTMHARACHVGMACAGTGPNCRRSMAIFAKGRRGDVRGPFTGGRRAIVAAITISNDTGVIDRCTKPSRRRVVTRGAIGRGLNVPGRFPGGDGAVVA